MTRRVLVIFLKAPRMGAVKTRLARDIGRTAAWRWYRNNSARTVHRLARDPRWRSILAVTPDRFARRGRFWPGGLARVGQGAGDLGARMARPFWRIFAGCRGTRVVLIGGDIPGITRSHIMVAFRALDDADAVFGPARDGGFWLVGLRPRALTVRPFQNVRWSHARVLTNVIDNLGADCRIRYVATLHDVDDGTDWHCSLG